MVMTETNRRPAPVRRRIVVRRVEQLSPNFVRIFFGGDELEGFSIAGPAPHIKLGFAAPGEVEFAWPERVPGQPPLGGRPPTRTFTPRAFDAASNELAVDFYLHGEGVASTWAREAGPGSVAGVSGPSRPYRVEEEVDGFLIAGDETAIPAIATLLEALGGRTPATVVLELADLEDSAALGPAAPAEVLRVQRADADVAGAALRSALVALPLSGNTRVWVASEALAIRQIRRFLVDERAIPARELTTRGYWKFGEANHPDHDFGED